MRTPLALAACLLASTALAQTRQPASITTIPTATPQTLYWLDKVGAWQPLSSAVNTWQISNVGGVANNVTIGPTASGPAIGLDYGVAQPSGNLNTGLWMQTFPGNIAQPGPIVWNLLYSLTDTVQADTKIGVNYGLFVDARLNYLNKPNVNGSLEALRARASVWHPTSPTGAWASVKRTYVGGQFDADLARGDNGANTTLTAAAAAGASSLTVADPTGFYTNDETIWVKLDSGKWQNFHNITVSGNTISWSAPTLASQASIGAPVYDARGNVFGHSSLATVGGNYATDNTQVGKNVSLLVNTEEDIFASPGSTVLYKSNLLLDTTAPGGVASNVHGLIIDSAIAITAALGSSGYTDGIVFHAAAGGVWPIIPTGGLIKVDGHNVNSQAMGYGVDMSWATISGNAFAFSTTGNGVPDNYWSNAGITATLPASGTGGVYVCIDPAGKMYRKATCP